MLKVKVPISVFYIKKLIGSNPNRVLEVEC